MTTPHFPATIYEGYTHNGRWGWVQTPDGYSEDLGIAMCEVVGEIGNDWPMPWRVRRTDHNPDTGEIEASYFVDEAEARAAGTAHMLDMDETPPDWLSGVIEGPDRSDYAYEDWRERMEAAE